MELPNAVGMTTGGNVRRPGCIAISVHHQLCDLGQIQWDISGPVMRLDLDTSKHPQLGPFLKGQQLTHLEAKWL